MALETLHLTLVPSSPQQILTLIDQPERFEEVAHLHAAEGLRAGFVSEDVAPAWLAALRPSSGPDPWQHGFFVVHRETRTVIGSAGFKDPPDAAGMVEIAYGIVPSFQGQGYATEAAVALVAFAFASAQVQLVRAHTLPVANDDSGAQQVWLPLHRHCRRPRRRASVAVGTRLLAHPDNCCSSRCRGLTSASSWRAVIALGKPECDRPSGPRTSSPTLARPSESPAA